jgi:hypothetical protein
VTADSPTGITAANYLPQQPVIITRGRLSLRHVGLVLPPPLTPEA